MREFRTGGFQILPQIVKNLIIINVLVFLATQTFERAGNSYLVTDLLALHTWQSPLFKPWQLVTHLFMHANVAHIFLNMLALWVFGSTLESLWGPKRFLTFYIICGLGAALIYMIALYFGTQSMINEFLAIDPSSPEQLMNFINKHPFPGNLNDLSLIDRAKESFFYYRDEPTVGASGAVFGCLTAFGYLFPNALLMGFPFFIPIKAKWVVSAYIVIELISAFQNSAGDNVAHTAHLGGALFGFLLVYFWNKTNRRTFY